MELSVGDASVLLTTHKTYGEMEELHCLRAVMQYPPLLTYLQSCADRCGVPSAVVVRSVRRVAHRITGAVVDIVYEDAATHTTTAHVLLLSDSRPSLLLPVVVVEGRRCALLAQERTLSQALRPVVTGIRGDVDENGHFTAAATSHAAALHRLGVSCTEAKPMAPHAFTIGNEGEPPILIFSMTLQWDEGKARELQSMQELLLLPLTDVLSAGDAGAALAASLLL